MFAALALDFVDGPDAQHSLSSRFFEGCERASDVSDERCTELDSYLQVRALHVSIN